ncbi:hypothetical protein [Pyramidobacter porci]
MGRGGLKDCITFFLRNRAVLRALAEKTFFVRLRFALTGAGLFPEWNFSFVRFFLSAILPFWGEHFFA